MASLHRVHYFAYGSNMSHGRLAARIAEPIVVGAAHLSGMRLACNKPGRDGSGKANIVPNPGAEVWGVVYGIHAAVLSLLDEFEPGYTREIHHVRRRDGRGLEAHAYRWLSPDPPLPPAAWYRDLILAGADEHGLPESHRREIESWFVVEVDPTGPLSGR